jgi:hypothetical protein
MRAVPLIGALTCLLFAAACSSPVQHRSGDAAPAGLPPATSAAPTTTSPPSSPHTSSPSARATSDASPAALVLGPDGYGPLKLGMTERQATATGLLTAFDDSWCKRAFLRGFPKGRGAVFLSPNVGIAAIWAWGNVETPEGVHIGTSRADLNRIYPHWELVDQNGTGVKAFVKVNDKARYRITMDETKVGSLALQRADQDCYE